MRVIAGVFCALVPIGVAQAQQQLLLLQHSWWETGILSYSDCVEVESDGSYQYEHTSLSTGRVDSRQIHAGTFNNDEIKRLNDILDEQSLQSLTSPKMAPEAVTGTDVWWVSIQRGNDTQRLWFASSSASNLVPASKLPDANRTPAMKPLLTWYKQLGKRKDDLDKRTSPKCSLKVKQR